VTTTVCAPTGLRPGPSCPSPVRELFVAGTEPAATETYYSLGADGELRIDPPLEARAWARDAGLRLVEAGEAKRELVRIVAPVPGSVYYVAPELPRQQVVLRAAVAPGVTRVTFAVDGAVVGETTGIDPWIAWPLARGPHTLRVTGVLPDGTTTSATTAFEVK
jgi:hypothetical protein